MRPGLSVTSLSSTAALLLGASTLFVIAPSSECLASQPGARSAEAPHRKILAATEPRTGTLTEPLTLERRLSQAQSQSKVLELDAYTICVSGAAGGTGKELLLKLLAQRPYLRPRAIVHKEEKRQALQPKCPQQIAA